MHLEPKTVYLLLGSNLGDRRDVLNRAIERIGTEIGEVTARSAFYETAAWGKEDQPSFMNIAVEMETVHNAPEVLERALKIEEELGRVRKDKWGARVIDIDIILFGNEVINDGTRLQVPHPRMQDRRFVLVPLAEIAGSVYHPVLQQNIMSILSSLKDDLAVSKIA